MAASSSEPAMSLSGYLVLCDLGSSSTQSSRARTCKVREKPNKDVPPFMDETSSGPRYHTVLSAMQQSGKGCRTAPQ